MEAIKLTPGLEDKSLTNFCIECRNIEQKIENISQNMIIATNKLYKIQLRVMEEGTF